jgi:hypothetical protein
VIPELNTSSDRLGRRLIHLPPERWDPLWPTLLHLSVAAVAYFQGLTITMVSTRGYWNWVWQAIPLEDLTTHPWQSLWYLHAQPPVFSLWGWAWLRMCGPDVFPDIMQLSYVLLGAATAAMTTVLGRGLMRRRVWGLVAGVAVALNPSLLLYENYLVYEPLVACLVTATAWSLWKTLTVRNGRWLALFVLSLNLLVMTRSMFHWFFLMVALGFAWPLWRAIAPGRRWALLLVAVALPGLWMTKNAVQWGFFGSSSWLGLGIYKCAYAHYNQKELEDLKAQGVLPSFVVDFYPYQHQPVEYEPFGFDQQSPVDFLARDNWHNVNIPAISRDYGAAALRLIAHDPWRYAHSVHDSYVKFSRPPSDHIHLQALSFEHIWWEPLVSELLYGQWFTDQIQLFGKVQLGSMHYFYFPLFLVATVVWMVGRRRRLIRGSRGNQNMAPEEWARVALMAYGLYLSLYVATVGCLFENGENERFRFALEPITGIMALVLMRCFWSRWARPIVRRLRPDQGFFHRSLGP